MTTGFIWGKFMPVHRGHMYLIDYARERVGTLTVLLTSRAHDPIPGALRYRWLCELYPGVDVQHCADELPAYPHEHPDYWNLWLPVLRRYLPSGPDFFFTSETYGDFMAGLLGARHICVDLKRRAFPVSGTQVRADPRAHWHLLPPLVQDYYRRHLASAGEAA